jgi:hypothetical protein
MVRRLGGAEALSYLMSSHMPTRVTVRSPPGQHMGRQT